MKLSVIVPPNQSNPAVPTAVAPRAFHEADAFAEALRTALDVDVPVYEAALSAAPAVGYVLAFGVRSPIAPQLAPRLVAIDVGRASIMELLETGLAGAVERQQYANWCAHRTKLGERALGLVGRKDIAARMGARIMTTPYTSTRYGALVLDQPGNLMTLLADYLRAYAAGHSSSP